MKICTLGMAANESPRIKKSSGFTLIELVLVITITSLVAGSMVHLFGQLAQGMNSNQDAQVANQLAQECSEYLIGIKRDAGYSMPSVTNCSALSAFNGNGPPSVSLTSPYTGTACPSPATCKLFTISATYNSGRAQTQYMAVSH